MVNECIWKCQTGKIIFRVLKVSDKKFPLGVSYRVYWGRKWWSHISYANYIDAIGVAVLGSLLGNNDVKITKGV